MCCFDVRLRASDFHCSLVMCLPELLDRLFGRKKPSSPDAKPSESTSTTSIFPIVRPKVENSRRRFSLAKDTKVSTNRSFTDISAVSGHVHDNPSTEIKNDDGGNGDDGDVFYTPSGECYHYDRGCKALQDSRSISSSRKNALPRPLRRCNWCGPRVVTNENSPFFKTKTGRVYHVRDNCHGLRDSKNITGVSEKPELDPCCICVLQTKFQNIN